MASTSGSRSRAYGRAAGSSTRWSPGPAPSRFLRAPSGAPQAGAHHGAVGAEGADPADLHLAGCARPAPAVPAAPDGFGVVVIIAMGHDGEIGGPLRSVNVPAEVCAPLRPA